MPEEQATKRRSLRFKTLDDVQGEVDRLSAAEAAGTLRTSGRWTFGQSLNHMATWADYCYDGTPLELPLLVRLLLRLIKPLMLYRGMRPGTRLPRVPEGTLATEPASTADALAHFRRSFGRLRNEPPTHPHMAFGVMTHAEWIALHLRHSELHLSFFWVD